MRNSNPRAYDPVDEWIECPKCRNVTVPLKDFEISEASEGPTASADAVDFWLFGLWAFAINYFAEAFSFGGRRAKLRQLKRDVLPQFPHSLVCPRCLNVIERV